MTKRHPDNILICIHKRERLVQISSNEKLKKSINILWKKEKTFNTLAGFLTVKKERHFNSLYIKNVHFCFSLSVILGFLWQKVSLWTFGAAVLLWEHSPVDVQNGGRSKQSWFYWDFWRICGPCEKSLGSKSFTRNK